MQKSTQVLSAQKKIAERSLQVYAEHRQQIIKHTDRLFAWLMIFQWLAGIAAAVLISPRVWAGQFSQIHLHVLAAVVLGAVINLPPIILGFTRPGKFSTRYIIGISQMLTSGLLIHLTGGRIETHFHIFGSLAFLAFYRDWTVLIPATIVAALDHLLRGIYWPQSIYGVLAASPWRWVEHAGWVIFEDIFLVISCLRSTVEMKEIAERTAQLEATNQIIETRVTERTFELASAKEKLENEIYERKKLEKTVIQSEKMSAVGQLAAGVAHEINNPLGVILGFSQNAAKRIPPGDPLELPLKSIEREAVRCKNLVQDLLTFSRVGKMEKEPVDLNQTIETALSLVLAQSKVKNTQLVKEFSAIPKIIGNKNQIQQIIVNLSNNAMDAMPQGGKLIIRLKTAKINDQDAVEIQVEDTGEGISPEIRSRVFDPFFTTKEIGKGTGLGLSLVYEIVQRHSGKIFLESKVGQGTVFRVLFPVSDPL